ILIISPNRVFADYISNVLPELGEEQVAETQMEALAAELLDHKHKFQTFLEQASLLLEDGDESLSTRIREKASIGFLRKIDEYADHLERTRFTPADIWVTRRRLMPAWFIEESFKRHAHLPVSERLRMVAKD